MSRHSSSATPHGDAPQAATPEYMVLGMVREYLRRAEESPGASISPFSAEAWRIIERALAATPPTTTETLSIELLRQWHSTYGGSTDPKGKPCTPELEERTDEVLRGLDRTSERKGR